MSASSDSTEHPAPREQQASVRASLRIMVLGGCLAMVYAVGIGSPATTEFFRAIGAREFHFGLITGIPLFMLAFQFVGAAALNRTARRKPVFIALLVFCRLLYLGVAFLPFAFREPGSPALLVLVLVLLAVSAASHNTAVPFWYSWMADLIPRRVLNRVWGWRQRAMHLTWSVAFLAVAFLLHRTRWPMTAVFPLLAVIAVAAGVTDVLLFIGVREPPNLTRPVRQPWRDLAAPLRHPDYRRFVAFSCAWSFATMCAASFMQLYVLKVIGLSPWVVTLIWCVSGVGMAIASGMWGRLADRHGHRPVLNVCVTLKPLIALVFLLLTPGNAVWLLPLAFLPDGMLNAGYGIAANGYMLSIAPRENRSMFIAAITGLAGMCGGLSAFLGGVLLARTQGWTMDLMGRSLNHYHLLFAASVVLRLGCRPLVRRVREPGSAHSMRLLGAMMDEWPMWIVRFPVGLYRRMPPFIGAARRAPRA